MGTGKKFLLMALVFLAAASSSAALYMDYMKPHDLEKYVRNNKEAEDMIISLCDVASDGSGMTAEVKKNLILYKYSYPEHIDDDIMDQLRSQFHVYADSMEGAYERIIRVLERESGFEGIAVKLVFCDNKGNELYQKMYR